MPNTTRKATASAAGEHEAAATTNAIAKAGAKEKGPPAKKAKPGASEAKPVKLLSGGNAQIAKAAGDAPVQAYIAAIPGWIRDRGKRLDTLIVRNVPNVRKAVKWNTPVDGIERQGSFLG